MRGTDRPAAPRLSRRSLHAPTRREREAKGLATYRPPMIALDLIGRAETKRRRRRTRNLIVAALAEKRAEGML